jgi:Holliday junction resolvase RusA-like endonuclease
MVNKPVGIAYFVPGNVPSSKNSKVWTGKFLVWSKAANKYRKETEKYWRELATILKKTTSHNNIAKPIQIYFEFVRGTKHKFDYVNPLQTVLDLMVEFGCLDDDNADEVFPVFRPYRYSKESPGVIISMYLHFEKK